LYFGSFSNSLLLSSVGNQRELLFIHDSHFVQAWDQITHFKWNRRKIEQRMGVRDTYKPGRIVVTHGLCVTVSLQNWISLDNLVLQGANLGGEAHTGSNRSESWNGEGWCITVKIAVWSCAIHPAQLHTSSDVHYLNLQFRQMRFNLVFKCQPGGR